MVLSVNMTLLIVSFFLGEVPTVARSLWLNWVFSHGGDVL